jgi:hypothetical protein
METRKRLGIPTYPIQVGMILGNREPDELEWLLNHGVFQTDIRIYYKIDKKASCYVCSKVDDMDGVDHPFAKAMSLTSLLQMLPDNLSDLAYWRWYIE